MGLRNYSKREYPFTRRTEAERFAAQLFRFASERNGSQCDIRLQESQDVAGFRVVLTYEGERSSGAEIRREASRLYQSHRERVAEDGRFKFCVWGLELPAPGDIDFRYGFPNGPTFLKEWGIPCPVVLAEISAAAPAAPSPIPQAFGAKRAEEGDRDIRWVSILIPQEEILGDLLETIDAIRKGGATDSEVQRRCMKEALHALLHLAAMTLMRIPVWLRTLWYWPGGDD